jgi:Ni,Fe-hydrogenase III component G
MTESAGPLTLAVQYLAPHGEAPAYPEANRIDVRVPVDQLLAAAGVLQATHWGHLAAITGLDAGALANTLEVLYHFCAGAAIVTLRVRVPRDAPVVPSLCALVPAAGLYERELSELLGVTFSDSPNSDRLYLPDDWPVGVYPLRKEAELPSNATGPSKESQ